MDLKLIIVFLFFACSSMAQINLVPNPSFEQVKTSSPSRTFTHGGYPFKKLIDPWYLPGTGTSDYYNSDFSNVFLSVPVKTARTGQGRIGIVVNTSTAKKDYAEYVQVKLLQPLEKDSLYCVTMHFSLDKRCLYGIPSLGICLTNEAVTDSTWKYFSIKPQVECTDTAKNSATKGWQQHSEIYKAQGGEQYLTLGAFGAQKMYPVPPCNEPLPIQMKEFARYAYYYFDDISVVKVHAEKDCTPQLAEKMLTPANNFVFLVDVSNSMIKAGYLSALKEALYRFAGSLAPSDRISLLVFDTRTKVLLRAVPASDKERLRKAIDNIVPGHTTNIDKAISRAYEVLDSTMVPNANNRVVLVSDAQFDISRTSVKIIKDHYSKKWVRFSMVQFGNAFNKKMDRTVASTKGVYMLSSQDTEALGQTLDTQVRKRVKRNDYTPERKSGLIWIPTGTNE